jgi:hypothetical protein
MAIGQSTSNPTLDVIPCPDLDGELTIVRLIDEGQFVPLPGADDRWGYVDLPDELIREEGREANGRKAEIRVFRASRTRRRPMPMPSGYPEEWGTLCGTRAGCPA